MAVTIKNRQWDVDGGGVACIITPGIPVAITTQVPSGQMDRAIARQTDIKARITAQRDEIQAELDTVTAIVDDLTTLRATVTAEPA